MLYFANTYITEYGYQLIGSAASDNNTDRIMWMSARTSSVNLNSADPSEIVAMNKNSFLNSHTCTGNVTSAIYNHAQAVEQDDEDTRSLTLTCELHSSSEAEGHGNAYSLVIYAKTDDGDSENIGDVAIIARCGNDHTPEEIPSGTTWEANVSLVINFTDSTVLPENLVAPDGFYATADQFNKLLNRVVTKEAASSTPAHPSGEAQDVYGQKTFKSKIVADNGIDVNDAAVFNSTAQFNGDIAIDAVATAQSIVPKTQNTYSLGSINNEWKNIYVGDSYLSSDEDHTVLEIGACTDQYDNVPEPVIRPSQPNYGYIGTEKNYLYCSHVCLAYANQYYIHDYNTHTSTPLATYIARTPVNEVNVLGKSDGIQCPLLFTNYINSSTTNAVNRALYTDTINSLWYNPYGNVLYSSIIRTTNIYVESSAGIRLSTFAGPTSYVTQVPTSTGFDTKFYISSNERCSICNTASYNSSNTTATVTTYAAAPSGTQVKWQLGTSNNHISDAYIDSMHGKSDTTAQVAILGNDSNAEYPIVFANSHTTSTSTASDKTLYTDSSTTSSLKYNPSTNTCYCGTFSGTFSGALSGNATTASSASQVGVLGKYQDQDFPVIFTTSVNSSYLDKVNRTLCTDTDITNALRYNPSTNTVSCGTFNGTATLANQVALLGKADNNIYPIVFSSGTAINTSSRTSRDLCTGTTYTLYYNPSTGTLYSTKFSGVATKAEQVKVSDAAENYNYYTVPFVRGFVADGGTDYKELYTVYNSGPTYNPNTDTLMLNGDLIQYNGELKVKNINIVFLEITITASGSTPLPNPVPKAIISYGTIISANSTISGATINHLRYANLHFHGGDASDLPSTERKAYDAGIDYTSDAPTGSFKILSHIVTWKDNGKRSFIVPALKMFT